MMYDTACPGYVEDNLRDLDLCYAFNHMHPWQFEERTAILCEILHKSSNKLRAEPNI